MKLTKEQIEKVDNYLEEKQLNYIDLKHEVLDHILSDIENLTEKISFENAFKITILKWDKHLRETSSFWLGLMYSNKNIVMKKAVKVFRPFYIFYLIAYFIPIIIFKFFTFKVPVRIASLINNVIYYLLTFLLLYVLVIIIKTYNSSKKTTYSFILKTQYAGLVFIAVILFVGGIFDNEGRLSSIFASFTLAGLSTLYSIHYFYKKHMQVLLKYKLT